MSSRRAAGCAGRRAFPIDGDRGSAGVWVLALSGVVLLSGTASVLAGVAIISRHEAGTAADLAALAAASQALSGSGAACGAAQEIAGANGAELLSCTLSANGVVDVAVTVTVQFGSLGLGVARADARAGPAETDDPARSDQPLVEGLPREMAGHSHERQSHKYRGTPLTEICSSAPAPWRFVTHTHD